MEKFAPECLQFTLRHAIAKSNLIDYVTAIDIIQVRELLGNIRGVSINVIYFAGIGALLREGKKSENQE